MKKKQINTGKAEILLVELPEGVHSINVVTKTDNPGILKTDHLIFSIHDGDGFDYYDSQSLPEGNWSILSRADEVTEEQAEQIVEFGDQEPGNDRYILKWRDYELSKDGVTCDFYDYSFDTALESLDSLYEANDVYWDNPLGLGARQYTQARFDLWKAYERNVWDKSRTYILINHK